MDADHHLRRQPFDVRYGSKADIRTTLDVASHINVGALKAYAIAADERSPALATLVKDEIARWAPIIKTANINR